MKPFLYSNINAKSTKGFKEYAKEYKNITDDIIVGIFFRVGAKFLNQMNGFSFDCQNNDSPCLKFMACF
jgi:hypothetical protein